MKDIPLLDPVTELKKLFDAKKFDAAIEFCQKLLEKDPNDPIALQNLSTAYYIVGAYEDSIKCSDNSCEKASTCRKNHHYGGFVVWFFIDCTFYEYVNSRCYQYKCK